MPPLRQQRVADRVGWRTGNQGNRRGVSPSPHGPPKRDRVCNKKAASLWGRLLRLSSPGRQYRIPFGTAQIYQAWRHGASGRKRNSPIVNEITEACKHDFRRQPGGRGSGRTRYLIFAHGTTPGTRVVAGFWPIRTHSNTTRYKTRYCAKSLIYIGVGFPKYQKSKSRYFLFLLGKYLVSISLSNPATARPLAWF